MEQVRQAAQEGRQLPPRHSLMSELRAQGTKKGKQREPEQRQRTVGAVKIWSVVE